MPPAPRRCVRTNFPNLAVTGADTTSSGIDGSEPGRAPDDSGESRTVSCHGLTESLPGVGSDGSEDVMTSQSIPPEGPPLEEGEEDFFELVGRGEADVAIHDLTLPVDDQRRGNAADLADQLLELVDHRIAGGGLHEDRKIVEMLLLHEDVVRRRVVVEGKSHDRQALVGVLLLQFDEPRDLLAAGRAPGRPEVEEEHLVVIVGGRNLLPVRQGDAPVGAPAVGGLALAPRAGTQERGGQEGGDSHRRSPLCCTSDESYAFPWRASRIWAGC